MRTHLCENKPLYITILNVFLKRYYPFPVSERLARLSVAIGSPFVTVCRDVGAVRKDLEDS